jgi:very-short-patch-repair endonuclease
MIRLRTPRRGDYAACPVVTVLEHCPETRNPPERAGSHNLQYGDKSPQAVKWHSQLSPNRRSSQAPFGVHAIRAPECRRSGLTGDMAMAAKTEEQLIETILAGTSHFIPESIDWILKSSECESPIERVMLASIYAYLRFTTPLPVSFWTNGFDAIDGVQQSDHVMLYTQGRVREYRVDILIVSTFGQEYDARPIKLAVECDGHEFHELTKEQAARDKARNRALQAHGITVLNFTGSEIWKAPFKCGHEVCMHLLRLMRAEQ